MDFFGRTTHLTLFGFCKKYEDPFGSPGAKPLAEAKRQKERSPKERSDDVTKSVCLSVCVCVVILSNLEHSKHMKQDVSWILQGCLMVISGCLKGVPRIF